MEETAQTAVETTDNSESEENLQEQISKALDEPEQVDTEKPEKETSEEKEPADNKQSEQDNIPECPDKFRNEDGTVDVEKLAKSYKELEPILNERAQWREERAELLKVKEQLDELNKLQEENAQRAGFNSAQDMRQVYEIAGFEANEYMKYLYCVDSENRENVRRMLIDYSNNPTEEQMREIELEFAPEINKSIAVQAFQKKREFAQEKKAQAETAKMTNIENVISKSVDSNNELFAYEPFKKMFVSTLQKYGDNFSYDDAKVLMDTITELKGLFLEEFKKNTGEKQQNNEATDKLAAITGTNSAPAAGQNPNTDNMTDKELAKYIRQYI